MAAASDSTRSTKVQIVDQGDSLVVKTGGIINIETGGKIEIAGVDVTSTAGGGGIAGAAAGYKLARSAAPVALDGANPTSVAHGLTTCVAAVVSLTGSVALGLGTHQITVVINGANLDIYGWKPTGAGDTTLIASAGTELFNWIAVGT